MLDEVKRLRGEIDHIDGEIVRLLKGRYEHAGRLGRVKRTRGLPLRDYQREEEILRNVQRAASEMSLPQQPIRRIFLQVFDMAVQAQKSSLGKGEELSGLQVLVAGGTGGMGRLFASLAVSHGASVRVFGRTASNTRKVASEIGVQPGNFSDAHYSDIVLVAVPTAETLKVSLKLAYMMKTESLLADLSSVKTGIADNIARKTGGIEYVSLHPLFGPDISHISGQHITAIPYRSGPRWKDLLRLFKGEGAHVHLTTAEAHDKTMAQIQGVHHFGLMCLGMALAGWSGEYSTRSLQITGVQIQRLVENWGTVLDIQRLNPFSFQGRRTFSRTVDRMAGMGAADSKKALEVLKLMYRNSHASNK